MSPDVFADMFRPGLPLVEKIVRPIIVYLFLVLSLRLAGKRELTQLNPFDLVVLLTLSNTVQNAIIGRDDSVTGGLVGAATLLIVNFLVVRFLFRHERLERLVEGDPTVLIENGAVRHEQLASEVISVSELESAAHRQGFADLAAVERCVLEAGGGLSFFGKKPDPEEVRHREITSRLDALATELAALRR